MQSMAGEEQVPCQPQTALLSDKMHTHIFIQQRDARALGKEALREIVDVNLSRRMEMDD